MGNKILDKVGNTKIRTLVLFAVMIVVISVLVIFLSTRTSSPTKMEESRSTKIPQITAIPGQVTSEKYKTLQEEDNRRRIATAKKTGGSAVPTIIGTKDLTQKQTFGIEDRFKECQ